MFQINPMPQQVSDEIRAAALEVRPATVGHFRLMGFPSRHIRPLGDYPRIAGTAVTLALPAADSTLLHYAASLVRPGDVLLIDRLGDDTHAAIGGGVAQVLAMAGLSTLIVDGPCTDPDEIVASGLPVWSRGVSSITTRLYGNGGAMNVPVSIGGAVVRPGDLILCDESGILAIGPEEAMPDIERAAQMQSWEAGAMREVAAGVPFARLSGAEKLIFPDRTSEG